MRYWETRNKDMCLNACDKKIIQRYVNPRLWMQVNEYGENGLTNHIQEIYITSFPIWGTNKESIVWSTPTYCSKNRYNIHKHIY